MYHKDEQRLILCFIKGTIAFLDMLTHDFKVITKFEDYDRIDGENPSYNWHPYEEGKWHDNTKVFSLLRMQFG